MPNHPPLSAFRQISFKMIMLTRKNLENFDFKASFLNLGLVQTLSRVSPEECLH